MSISRREFIRLSASAAVALSISGCDMFRRREFRYESSMAPITNLYAKYHYTSTSLPIVIVMHGWT